MRALSDLQRKGNTLTIVNMMLSDVISNINKVCHHRTITLRVQHSAYPADLCIIQGHLKYVTEQTFQSDTWQ